MMYTCKTRGGGQLIDNQPITQRLESLEDIVYKNKPRFPESFYRQLAADVQGKCRIYVLCRAGGAVTVTLDGTNFITKRASDHRDTVLMFEDKNRSSVRLGGYYAPHLFGSQYNHEWGAGNPYGTNATDLLEVLAVPVVAGNYIERMFWMGNPNISAPYPNLCMDFWDLTNANKALCRGWNYNLNRDIIDLSMHTVEDCMLGHNDGTSGAFCQSNYKEIYLPHGTYAGSQQACFNNCQQLERISLEGTDFTGATVMDNFFKNTPNLKEVIGLENLTVDNATQIWYMFQNCGLKRIEVPGLKSTSITSMYWFLDQCPNLEYADISGISTESIVTGGNTLDFTYNRCPNLRYVKVGPKFFASTAGPANFLNTCFWLGNTWKYYTTCGLNKDNESSNGWLEYISQIAPTIRLKEGYGTDDTIPLYEEENGIGYFNDGVPRGIALGYLLTGKEWAQPYLQILQDKGYTIS